MVSQVEGRRVLVVEDDFFVADDLVQGLRAAGVVVVGPAATVEAALDLVAATASLDGAVVDINLRGAMAYPVADTLAARSVPFVFATGYDDGTIPDRYRDVPRCPKPTTPDEVARALFG